MRGLPGGRLLSLVAWQTLVLFFIEGVSNVIDYVFHIYLGRALAPAAFATVQTINALFLVVGTSFAVLQPVVARFVAGALASGGASGTAAAVFQRYVAAASALGAAAVAVLVLGRIAFAELLNVPPSIIVLAAFGVGFLLARPPVNGMLQGLERFVRFGLTHTAYAAGRLILAILLVGVAGAGAAGAVASMSTGASLALLAGVLFVGAAGWRRTLPEERSEARAVSAGAWRLAAAAFVAYAAYMTLLNVDIIWMNRVAEPEAAAAYAGIAVLRRILAVLPGAILIVAYPRLSALVAQNRVPDRALGKAALAITLPTAFLTLVYFVGSGRLVSLVFGGNYAAAGPLLGWLGVGMIGFGLTALWMNLFLASRPWPFVVALAGIATAVVAILAVALPQSPDAFATAVFASSGWLAAVAGGLLYGFWLRPQLLANAHGQP